MRHVPVFNHLGQCVADLARSRRFYEDVLGFEFWREIEPPDSPSDRLLRVSPPIGMTACYLRGDGLVLERPHYAAAGTTAPTTRVMNEQGLTHVSLSVDDIDAVCDRIPHYGGEVLTDTNIGFGVFVRDPDGQLTELLPMSYREQLVGGGRGAKPRRRRGRTRARRRPAPRGGRPRGASRQRRDAPARGTEPDHPAPVGADDPGRRVRGAG